MSEELKSYEELFYDLHTGVRGDHERPHKPVMLLAVMDLIQSGRISNNLVPFSDELRKQFTKYFETVRSENDKNTPIYPYFHLKSEDFWSHVATPGNEALVRELSSPPGIKKLPSLIQGARLAPNLWQMLQSEKSRSQLRDVLISRYFPQHRKKLLKNEHPQGDLQEGSAAYEVPARSAGFRKMVVQVYEHQCAACGLRLRGPDGATIVDAAHIIPFAESHNDHPRNGLALCKNHHWAMDRSLIAPDRNQKWKASQQLDDRQPGQLELIKLNNRSLILPREQAYHPLPEALEWREQRLA